MPSTVLTQKEIEILQSINLNQISNAEIRQIVYHLNLLLNTRTGEIEIPGEMIDIVRIQSIHRSDEIIELLRTDILGRSFGEDLDYGFFD